MKKRSWQFNGISITATETGVLINGLDGKMFTDPDELTDFYDLLFRAKLFWSTCRDEKRKLEQEKG